MRSTVPSILVLAASALITACDRDPVDPTESIGTPNLARTEVLDLLDAFGESFVTDDGATAALGTIRADSSLRLRIATRAADPTSVTVRCPNGGTLTMNLATPYIAGAPSALFNFTHADCSATSRSGRTWNFNGDPTVQARLSFPNGLDAAVTGGRLIYELNGGFQYRSASRAGRCGINARFELTYTRQRDGSVTESTVATGSVCGLDVNETL
jgi:hypothetical protein